MGIGALDPRIVVVPLLLVLACQTRITAVVVGGGGLTKSSTSQFVETPFLVCFRRLGGISRLVGCFDMEEKVEERFVDYVNNNVLRMHACTS